MASIQIEKIQKDIVSKTVKDFQEVGLYTKDFLEDLEKGLRNSSYGKR